MARTNTPTTDGMRRCIGSTTFGIESHEAPVDDFPVQASAKDGLGRMCRVHWTAYTRALRKASVARKADVESTPQPVIEPEASTPRRGRRAKAAPEPEAVAG
ncbi:MAG: hypothetical protein U0667_12915 [Chloroflexota bacterium]